MSRTLPLWRSLLFVPATNERFLASAPRRGADAIQIDLEDSVPLQRKAEARRGIAAVARTLASHGLDVVVRVNRPWRLAIADIEASVGPDVGALNLPKVPGAAHIRAIGEILDELEREQGLPAGHTRLIAMIETAEGLLNVAEIARASDRIVGLTIGAEDLALSMGMEPNRNAPYVPNQQVVVAAAAAGCLAIGYVGTVAEYEDEAAFRATVWRARRLGFTGGFCIHPRQVPILNEEFSPPAKDVETAIGIVQAYEVAVRAGQGAVVFQGRMIDQPVVDRAQALLQRARHIAAKRSSGPPG